MAFFIVFFKPSVPIDVLYWITGVIAIIDYVKKNQEGFLIVCENGEITAFDIPLKSYLERLAMEGLSTVDGRMKAVGKRFGYRSRIPIYLKKNILFIVLYGLRSPKALLLNYHAVKTCRKIRKGVAISFYSNHEMLYESMARFREAYKKAKAVSEALLDMQDNIESAYMDF